MKLMKKQDQPQSNDKKRVLLTVVKKKYYNMADNISKPLRLIYAILGKTYEITGPIYRNRLYFKCIKPGRILIKYLKGPGHDILVFKGEGILRLDQKKTEGK